MTEMQELIRICTSQAEFLTAHEAQVDEYIEREGGDMTDSLRTAKNTCLVNQRELLRECTGALDQFLQSIVLYQNKLNHIWAPHAQAAAQARQRHCPHLSRYEISGKVESIVDSFPQLDFQSHQLLSLFKKTTKRVSEAMRERGIRLVKESGGMMKDMDRAFYKAFFVYKGDEPYRKLTDMLRASYVFDSFDELYRGFTVLEEVWQEHGGILRAKDRFAVETAPFGYRDLLLNVYAPNSQIVCEVQLHHTSMYDNKKGSHAIYKKARVFNSDSGNRAYEFAEAFIRPVIGDEREPDEEEPEIDEKSEEAVTMGFRELLDEFNLAQFSDKFEEDGWDDPKDWPEMDPADLTDMGFKKGHLKRWTRVVSHLENEIRRRRQAIKKPAPQSQPPVRPPVAAPMSPSLINDTTCPFTVVKHKMLLGEQMEVSYDLSQSSLLGQFESGSGWVGLVPSVLVSRAEQPNDSLAFTTKFHMQGSIGRGMITLVDGPGEYHLKGFTSDDPRRGVQIGMARKIVVEYPREVESRLNEQFFQISTEPAANNQTMLTVTWDFSGAPDVWKPLTQGFNVGWIGLVPTRCRSRSEIINDLNHKQFFSLSALSGTTRILLTVPPGFYEVRAFTADQGGTQIGAGIPIRCGLDRLQLSGNKILSLNPDFWNEEEKTFVVMDTSGTIDVFWDLTNSDAAGALERDGWIGIVRPGILSRNEVDHDSAGVYYQYLNTDQTSGHISFAMREPGNYDIKLFSSDRSGVQLGDTLSLVIRTSEETQVEMNRQVLFIDGQGPFQSNSPMRIRFDFLQCSETFKPVLGKGWIGFVVRGISSRMESPNGAEGKYAGYAYLTGYQGVWTFSPTFKGEFTLKAFTVEGGVQIGTGIDVVIV